MFSRIFTVMSVQLIETRKMVALIAVIERMKTTPSPAKNAGTMSGSVMRRKVVPLPAPRPCEASSRLLSICGKQRDGRADAGRAVAEDVAGDDDERGAGQHERRIVERDQVGDADDGTGQRVVDHRHELQRAPADELLARDEVAHEDAVQAARAASRSAAMISVSRIAFQPSVKIAL